ncbi:hypothetical protein LXA43DRAFT_973007 [Ganoderma leucocontextum]|nr:hypothetical protein LXA43DRAFT_973007 [Ganoderma leucocontextum]
MSQMQAQTYLDYKTFVETFWKAPTSPNDPLLRQNPAPNHYTLRSIRQTTAKASERQGRTPGEYMRWLVDKLKLCPNHSLCLDDTSLDGKPEWGHMEPINDSRPAWARPQVLFLFNVKDSESPGPTEPYRRKDVIARAQHQFAVQHLTAVFVVVVGHDFVQPVRCDRSGTVLSRPKDYIRDPAVLPDLFWRLSMLTEEQLGLDPMSVPILPGTSHYNFMKNLAQRHDDIDIPWHDGAAVPPKVVHYDPLRLQHWRHARSWFRGLLDPADNDDFKHDKPLWKLIMPNDEEPDVPREFLVGAPLSYRPSVGASIDERNTRVFVAYDLEALQFVCLKDTWREVAVDGVLLEREGEVLRRLNRAGVPYVPTLMCEADLPGQDTRTPEFWTTWDRFPDNEEPTRLRHYRMVTEEICLQLSEVSSSRQLVSVMHDCITAHASAAKHLGLLHGDLSYGNILVCPTIDATTNPEQPTVKWRGMLMDWEFPRLAPTQENKGSTNPHGRRSWKFTSIAYMHSPKKPLTVADELESFFYILLYTAALHLPSNLHPPDAPNRFLDTFFSAERSSESPCGWSVSASKRLALRQARILSAPAKDELRFYWRRRSEGRDGRSEPLDKALNALLQEYLTWCHANYVQNVPRRGLHRDLPRTYRNPAVAELDVGELARKLGDYDAVQALFEAALKTWPEGRDEDVVKSEPGEEEVPAEEFWKAMAQKGGAGEGTEVAGATEANEGNERRRKLPVRGTRARLHDAEKTKKEETGVKAGKGTKPSHTSSRRIRGEAAPDPEELPAKRRRR